MRTLAIELGSWSLKAVELESRFRRLEILDFHEVKMPLRLDDPAVIYKEALNQLLSSLPSNPEQIIISLPPTGVALRFLPFPIKQRKKVEQMYRFELEDNIPFKLEDAIVTHHFFKTKEGSLIFAAIAPKSLVQKQLDSLLNIGIDVDWLTFDGMGIVNLALSATSDNEEDTELQNVPTMVLDLGHTKTTMVVTQNDVVKYFRSIQWGGMSITNAIALNTSVSLEEADGLKATELELGGSPNTENEITASAIQAINPLLTDVHHSIAAYRNQYKEDIKRIHIVGGTALTKGIAEFLTQRLGMPVSRLKPFDHIELKESLRKPEFIRFAEVLGRGLITARKLPILFNFRKEELAKQTSLTEVKEILSNPHIRKVAQYLGILAAMLFIHVNIAGILAEQELKKSNDELKKVFGDTFRAVPAPERTKLLANPEQLAKFIAQKNKDLEEKLKMLSKTKTPTIGIIRQISDAFPQSVRVDINTLEFDDRTFNIQGVLYEGELNSVTDNLKKISTFNEVALNLEGQRFTFSGKVVGR